MQPVFTRLANLLQNIRYASGQDQADIETPNVQRSTVNEEHSRQSVICFGCWAFAVEFAEFQRIVTKLFQDFLYFTGGPMRNNAALSPARSHEADHRSKPC
jgi:hypothetical protein